MQFGECPDPYTLGKGERKKDMLKGDLWRTTVVLYPGVVVKTEQHKGKKATQLFSMYRSMIGQHDPTRATLMGVKMEELKPKEKIPGRCFEITTWTELLPGEPPTPGCISPEEAAALYKHAVENATWFGLHHDLHCRNAHVWRDTKGQLKFKVIDFGHGIETPGCPGDTSAFSEETKRFVRSHFCPLPTQLRCFFCLSLLNHFFLLSAANIQIPER